ncbi:MAG: class I SAM-dependent methyltransferase [Planctomycetota bacterium]
MAGARAPHQWEPGSSFLRAPEKGDGLSLPSPAAAARVYDRIYRGEGFGDSPRFYRWVMRLAAPAPGARILDIGCGTGGALAALRGAGCEAWGIDISRQALLRARRAAPEARLLLADGAHLPFCNGAFDLVLSLGNLEHFTDLEGGIREARRVLSERGRAWLLLPNLFYSGTIWRVLRGGSGPDHHQPIDRFATKAEWAALLEAGGLRVVRSFPYHKGKWWKRLLPAALAWHFLYETHRGEPSGAQALPPLERVRRAD